MTDGEREAEKMQSRTLANDAPRTIRAAAERIKGGVLRAEELLDYYLSSLNARKKRCTRTPTSCRKVLGLQRAERMKSYELGSIADLCMEFP